MSVQMSRDYVAAAIRAQNERMLMRKALAFLLKISIIEGDEHCMLFDRLLPNDNPFVKLMTSSSFNYDGGRR